MPEKARKLLGLALLAAVLTSLLWIPVIEKLEVRTYDLRFQARGMVRPEAKVVIVNIDNATLDAWHEPKVAWGAHFANLMESVTKAGGNVIGLDLVIATDTDGYLAEITRHALIRAGKTSTQIAQWEADTSNDPLLHPNDTFLQFIESSVAESPNHVVLSDAGPGSLNDAIASSGVRIGTVAPPQQPDEAIRILSVGPASHPTFLGQLAEATRQHPFLAGDFWINYYDVKPATAFPILSAEAVARQTLTKKEREGLRGATVLIGASDNGLDDHFGVGGRMFSGTEILAHGLASLLDGRALHRSARWGDALLSVLFAFGSGLLLVRPRFLYGSLLLIGSVGLWMVIAQTAFTRSFLLLPVVVPLTCLIVPFTLRHVENALAERRLRQMIEHTFGRYTGAGVRDYLLESVRNRDLGGREVIATSLFFDLRGSTLYAESRSPEEVLAELNRLFSRIIPCVLAREGLVLTYSGDGFTALFGAPKPRLDHAQAAVEAALELVRVTESEMHWKCGIGINTGPLIFGSMGSPDRPDFTIIGDSVNVAARLQEATKTYKCPIVVSEATYEAARDVINSPLVRGPMAHTIRGRQQPLCVYLLSTTEAKDTPVISEGGTQEC